MASLPGPNATQQQLDALNSDQLLEWVLKYNPPKSTLERLGVSSKVNNIVGLIAGSAEGGAALGAAGAAGGALDADEGAAAGGTAGAAEGAAGGATSGALSSLVSKYGQDAIWLPVLVWLTTSKNWVRVLEYVGGAIAIGVAVRELAR